MDFKLKLQAIACVSVVICLVLAAVVLVNDQEQSSGMKQQSSSAEGAQTAEVSDATVAGGEDSRLYEIYQLNPYKDPYAFMQEDDFFDRDEEKTDQSRILSLLVSTTQKDLRVNVVDGNGQLAEGQDISIYLTKDGEQIAAPYKDEDADGMLYIPQLEAGDYQVTLSQIQGYSVPQEPVSVQVTEDISYTVIDDISFLIKTENEIDPSREDTAVKEAENDADGTETNKRLQDGASVFGIDVSKWNKKIDWEKVKDAGVEFAIIRCGYRGSQTGVLVEDPYFVENIKGATDAGIRVGVYFFTQALTPIEAVEEASMVLMLCKDYKVSYPLFIDTEGAGGKGRADKLDKTSRTAVCKAFCETVENAGFTAGVYASKSWLSNNLQARELASYSTWLAQYSSQPTYRGEYDMWQYTSAGTVDGISTLVDFNVSYMDY